MTLAPVELATGIVFGSAPSPLAAAACSPAEALLAAVRPAVAGGRGWVSFTGGRDSSAVRAAAAAVARREGLPLPVAVTVRAANAPEADEASWQEAVVRHVGIEDWIRLEVDDELDALGPYARRALTRHGLLWPFNAHFHAPMLEQAAGGTLLTGIGGDELWHSPCRDTTTPRRRLVQLAPPPLRRALLGPRQPIRFPWLSARGRRAAQRAAAGDALSLPRTVSERMAAARGARYLAVGTASLELLAADAGAAIAHPLLDACLWSAIAAAAPRAGFADAAQALAAAAGPLLPSELVERRTKANLNAVFFNAHARAFADTWSGRGVPTDLVDVAQLGAHWRRTAPDPHSLTLLQAAWVSAGDRLREPGRRGTE